MKIENNKEKIETEDLVGENEVIEAGIDQKNLGFLFDIVSSQMYSNPIGSLIREITSNCFDSHAEAGIVEPIRVALERDLDSGYRMEFEDFGVGIGPKRMKKIYSKYFSSTKRDTNDQIGMFGLGSKSPLAYCNAFKIRTRFEGIEYLYLVRKGQEKPVIELIYDKPTTERNGSCVMVPVKNEDVQRFKEETKSQLSLFRDIIFYNLDINNDYFIIETDTFKYRPDFQFSPYMHLCIGDVSYPIDYDTLGITPLQLPIAIKFEIGEISVNPQREAIRYLDGVKEKILEKIKVSITEILAYYNKKTRVFSNIADYSLRKRRRRGRNYYELILHSDEDRDYSLNVAELIEAIEGKLPFYEGFKLSNERFPALSDIDVEINDHHFIPYMLKCLNGDGSSLEEPKKSYWRIRRFSDVISSYSDLENYLSMPSPKSPFTPNIVINRTSANKSTLKDEYLEENYKYGHRIYSFDVAEELFSFRELKRWCKFPPSGYNGISNVHRYTKVISLVKEWLSDISIDYEKLKVPKFWTIQREERIREEKRLRKEQDKLRTDIAILNFTDKFPSKSRADKEYGFKISENLSLGGGSYSNIGYIPSTFRVGIPDIQETASVSPSSLAIQEVAFYAAGTTGSDGPSGIPISFGFGEHGYIAYVDSIPPKVKSSYTISSLGECTPNRSKVLPSFLDSYKGVIIYGFKSDYEALKKAAIFTTLVYGKSANIVSKKHSYASRFYQIYQISEKNKKHFKELPNAIHVSKFYSMENPLFEKIACAVKLRQSGVMDIINRINPVYRIQDLNRELYSSIKYLYEFQRNYNDYHENCLSQEMEREVLNVIKLLNIGNELFDFHLNKVSKYFEGLEILKYVNFEDETAFNLAISLAKEKKKKVNFYHYLSVPLKIRIFLRMLPSLVYKSCTRGIPDNIGYDRKSLAVSQLSRRSKGVVGVEAPHSNLIERVFIDYHTDFKVTIAKFKDSDEVEELTEEQIPISVENIAGVQVCEPANEEKSYTKELIYL